MASMIAGLIAWTLAAGEPPPACVEAAANGADARRAYEALVESRVEPLCLEATPAADDWAMRRTITYRPGHRWVLELHARRGRVQVEVFDTLFQPSESTDFVSRLSPQRLRRLLDDEGWREAWTAADPDCATTPGVGMEIGTVWEFLDASGYRARLGPKAQFCNTPYKRVIHDVSEFLDEVVLLTKLR